MSGAAWRSEPRVMAGLVPAIPMRFAQPRPSLRLRLAHDQTNLPPPCSSDRGGRDKPGHDARAAAPPRRQRADARIALAVARLGDATRLTHLAETGSARLRLPKSEGPALEAVTINTGGGIAAGDRFATDIEVAGGAELVVTTAAAEKIYRSEGDTAAIATTIRVAEGGRLDWVPQETILYDAARLRRSLQVDLEPGASALLFEAVVFGRAAFGETMRSGAYEDRWRVRRGGRMVFADTLRLGGAIDHELAKPTVAAGHRALATVLYIARDAESRIEDARAALEGAACECGASAWNGLLAVRFLARDIETLRRDAARFMTTFRRRPMPRVWSL